MFNGSVGKGISKEEDDQPLIPSSFMLIVLAGRVSVSEVINSRLETVIITSLVMMFNSISKSLRHVVV